LIHVSRLASTVYTASKVSGRVTAEKYKDKMVLDRTSLGRSRLESLCPGHYCKQASHEKYEDRRLLKSIEERVELKSTVSHVIVVSVGESIRKGC
jgi:hypothetical protein